MKKACLFLMTLTSLFLTACQKVAINDGEEEGTEDKVTLNFHINQLDNAFLSFYGMSADTQQQRLSTRSTDITSLCSRINLAVYQSGTRVSQVNQEAGDKNFGAPSVSLKPGQYDIVILAHNYASNPTLTDPEKITFGKDLTDIFLWTGNLDVEKDENRNVSMHRVVAMFRLTTTDTIPSDVAMIRFYYTGGSSSLNAHSGLGCVNSKQTASFAIDKSKKGQTASFDVFTIPKAEGDNLLKITVTAYDASNNIIVEKNFTDVPVKCNQITHYTGKLFDGGEVGSSDNVGFHLTTDDEWSIVERSF